MDASNANEVLLIGLAANASMGLRRHALDRVLGLFGIDHINATGRELELYDLLISKAFCSVATLFMQSNYLA